MWACIYVCGEGDNPPCVAVEEKISRSLSAKRDQKPEVSHTHIHTMFLWFLPTAPQVSHLSF